MIALQSLNEALPQLKSWMIAVQSLKVLFNICAANIQQPEGHSTSHRLIQRAPAHSAQLN